LKKGSIPIKNEAEIQIQNIVASANLGGKVHLEEATRQLQVEVRAGTVPGPHPQDGRPQDGDPPLRVGKLVCTGAKRESEVYRAVNNLHALLEEKDLMVY
jgi:transcription initiation factor TFIID TATA-box-binding protein